MRIFIFLHIVTMFSAVAVSYLPEVLMRRAVLSGSVPLMRSVGATIAPVSKLPGPVFGIGLIFGLTAVFTGGFNPLAPWLLIAYVIFVIATIVGAGITGPWAVRVGELAAASPADAPSPELTTAMRDPRMGALVWLNLLFIVGIIFDMVIKPFS